MLIHDKRSPYTDTKILEEEENFDDNNDIDDIHDRPPHGGYIFAPVSETKNTDYYTFIYVNNSVCMNWNVRTLESRKGIVTLDKDLNYQFIRSSIVRV